MRDYKKEFEDRVAFIRDLVAKSGARGIIFGNSGGKDSALVGILCKAACDNTIGLIMPCSSRRNFGIDTEDGKKLAEQYDIETRIIDLTPVREAELKQLSGITEMTEHSAANIAPRLRMTTLYSVAGSEGLLVAGTGNRSEIYVGYFTKWGDGACDFNPISDLTVTEVYEFLRYLNAPLSIIEKAPSAGLYEGQTDETEMGIKYSDIDALLLNGADSVSNKGALEKIERMHAGSLHKTVPVKHFKP